MPSLRGDGPPDLILLNADDAGYVIVRFDPRSLQTVLSSVGALPDLAARAVCWNTVIDMVRQAELPVMALAAMLARALRSEPSAPGAERPAGAGGLADHAVRGPPAGGGGQGAAGAGLGGDPWCRAGAGTPLGALRRLAAAGEADDARIDAALAADPSDAGRRSAAACRAAIPDAAHKEAAWRLLTGGGAGPETVTAVADGFLQPEHADLLAPYADRYLSELPGLWETRDGHLRVRLAHALFPYPAVTPAFLARLDGFLTADAADPGLARIVRDHRDTAERVLRARTRYGR